MAEMVKKKLKSVFNPRTYKSKRNKVFKFFDSNIAFMCTEPLSGFEIGKIYKPFGYTSCGDAYKNYTVIDEKGHVCFILDRWITSQKMKVIFNGREALTEYEQFLKDLTDEIEYADMNKYVEILFKGDQ